MHMGLLDDMTKKVDEDIDEMKRKTDQEIADKKAEADREAEAQKREDAAREQGSQDAQNDQPPI